MSFLMWDLFGTTQATNLVSIFLVVTTGAYVLLTNRIARANAQMAQQLLDQQEDLSRPIIVANIEIRSQVMFVLVIRNAGKAAATDVRLSIESDFFRFGKHSSGNLRDLKVFQREPFTLASGDALRFDLAQGFVIFAKEADESVTPKVFRIDAAYSSIHKLYREMITVDLRPYLKTSWPKTDTNNELENIAKAIQNLEQTWKSGRQQA